MSIREQIEKQKEKIKRQNELHNEAERYLEDAKEIVNDAKIDYDNAYKDAQYSASEAESDLRDHISYKKEIAKELDESTSVTIKNFTAFGIDSKTVSTPRLSSLSIRSNVSGIVAPDLLPGWGSAEDEYHKAKEKYEAARRYRNRMNSETAKLESHREKMEELCSFISAERKELDSLMKKIRKMSGELNAAMQKNSFTQEEANYLKGIQKISESIISLIQTEFLGDGFSVSQRYKEAFNKMKRINQSLPAAPSISDVSTRSAIGKILDGMIVY